MCGSCSSEQRQPDVLPLAKMEHLPGDQIEAVASPRTGSRLFGPASPMDVPSPPFSFTTTERASASRPAPSKSRSARPPGAAILTGSIESSEMVVAPPSRTKRTARRNPRIAFRASLPPARARDGCDRGNRPGLPRSNLLRVGDSAPPPPCERPVQRPRVIRSPRRRPFPCHPLPRRRPLLPGCA